MNILIGDNLTTSLPFSRLLEPKSVGFQSHCFKLGRKQIFLHQNHVIKNVQVILNNLSYTICAAMFRYLTFDTVIISNVTC